MSANYPHAYPRRTDCIWHITVEDKHQVVLTFNDFDVEPSTGCRFDYVTVSTHTAISIGLGLFPLEQQQELNKNVSS